ncbi:MAG: hypothetical protein WA988_03475 [Candidatus Nanopelagicales bacterium]
MSSRSCPAADRLSAQDKRELVTEIAEAFTRSLQSVYAGGREGDEDVVRRESVSATKRLLSALSGGGWMKTWTVDTVEQASGLPANALLLDSAGDAARVHIFEGHHTLELLGTETEDGLDCVLYPLTVVRNPDPVNWPPPPK